MENIQFFSYLIKYYLVVNIIKNNKQKNARKNRFSIIKIQKFNVY